MPAPLFTGAECAEIAARYQAGESLRQIAAGWSVSTTPVRRALRQGQSEPRAVGRPSLVGRPDAFDELTEQAVYWLGFLMADGSITNHHDRARLSLALSERDLAHLKAFRVFLGARHTIGAGQIRGYEGSGRYCRLSLDCPALLRRLAELGFRGPSASRCGRVEVAGSSHYWRGLVDGDGALGMYQGKPRLSLLGNEAALLQFRHFAQGVLPGTNPSIRHRPGILEIQFSGRPAFALTDALYRTATVALDRKAAKAKAILESGWKPKHERCSRYTEEFAGFVTPGGVPVEPIRDLPGFCRAHGLDYMHMLDVWRGRRRSHAGWTCTGEAKHVEVLG